MKDIVLLSNVKDAYRIEHFMTDGSLRMRWFPAVVAVCCLLLATASAQAHISHSVQIEADVSPVHALVEYLAVDTFQPKPDYVAAVQYLQKYAQSLGLFTHIEEIVPGKPLILISLTDDWFRAYMASNSSSSDEPTARFTPGTVLFYSHSDVVPAEYSKWTVVTKLQQRGSQDMKSVTIQHIAALGRLLRGSAEDSTGLGLSHGGSGVPRRTLMVAVLPDEEIGGRDGIVAFRSTRLYSFLNIHLVVDEGLASGQNVHHIPLFYAEKAPLWLKIHATGQPGHGSRFTHDEPAATRLMRTVNRMLHFRDSERERWLSLGGTVLDLGDVVTMSLTYLNGGDDRSMNVIPSAMQAGFDVRVPPQMSLAAIVEMVESWAAEDNNRIEWVQKSVVNPVTEVPDRWIASLDKIARKHGASGGIKPAVFPASTDARHVRAIGTRAVGLSFMPDTAIMLHEHDEVLAEHVFLSGVDFFTDVMMWLQQDETF
jgi:aminoacylase